MDVLTPEQRHKNMQNIKAKDTKIELLLRKDLWHLGFRYRKNCTKLPGKPDIAIMKYRIAIFCDSEFFHGKNWDELKIRLDKGNNSDFWKKKIQSNIERDKRVNKELTDLGWVVLRFWGQDIKKYRDKCIQIIKDNIAMKIESQSK